MTEPLRPMNLGGILDRTFHIYRSRFLVFVLIGIAPQLAHGIFLLLGEIERYTTLSYAIKEMLGRAANQLPNDWPASFVHFLGWPLIAYLVSRDLQGERPTLTTALKWCRNRWKSWLAISALLWAVCTVVPFLLQRLIWASGLQAWAWRHLGFEILSSPGSLLFFLAQWSFGSLLVFAIALSAPVWAIEQIATLQSIRRGWPLVRGIWIRIVVTLIMRDALQWILTASLMFVVGILFKVAFRNYADEAAQISIRWNIFVVMNRVSSVLVAPLLPIAVTLFYYDQRIRLEGYDIERMMTAAGLNPTAPPTSDIPGAAPSAPEAQP